MQLGPFLKDCPEYYRPYLETLDPQDSLVGFMRRQRNNFPKFIQSIPDNLWLYRYAEGKWSVAEALMHVLDTERVFQYRALRFGRKDETPLPGFDQDAYVPQSRANGRTPESVIEEYQAVRTATIMLFETFTEEDLLWKGTASTLQMSLGTLGCIICGHQRHHRDVLRTRYLGR